MHISNSNQIGLINFTLNVHTNHYSRDIKAWSFSNSFKGETEFDIAEDLIFELHSIINEASQNS